MMKHKLPDNWVVLPSKKYPDRVYYFNVKTNQSSWEQPTADQTEQTNKRSAGSSKKRKKSTQKHEISQVQPTTPEDNMSEKEIFARKKLIAKKTLKQSQTKANEEKDTPQMKALREKMLKKKEKGSPKTPPKSSKDALRSPSAKSEKSSRLVEKSDVNLNLEGACTPQMQVLLTKMREKESKHTPKSNKADEERSSTVHEQGKPIKSRLRNQGACNQTNVSEVSPTSESKNKKQERNGPKVATIEKSLTGKKRNEECDLAEITIKRSRKSLKKNLGKERMEKLRRSLTEQYNDTLNYRNEEKLPNIYKNAEVRLVRLKGRFINDKTSINKNSRTDEPKETANSSKEVITTVDNLITRSNKDSFYEEMDWEPLEDEKITFEVQAVRTRLCTENSAGTSCNVPSNTLKYPLLSEQQGKKHLYIVVDTNVFLSNIDAVELAKETTFKIYNYPIIVIPWTVIRELDYIKDDNGKTKSTILCIKARKAVNYINELLSSKQPRVISQTPEEVAKNKARFSTDCPDDEILQTCLHIRDLGKSVVLLSYDVNLCNKAMIYDIVTLGRNDPFEKIDYLNATNYLNESLIDSNTGNTNRSNLDSISILSREICLSDEIYEDVKSIIRDFLTVIVSKEMQTLYGEFWEKYVLIRPPWTTVAVLQCAIKHWIAAVSESFQRKADVILKELFQIFKNTSGKRTLKEDSYILDKCSALVQMINTDKHRDLMLRVSKKINELKEKCHEYESQINEQKLRDVIGAEHNIEEQERRAQKAFQYFEAAYVYARDICGLVAEAIGMPCTFNYNIPNPVPSMDYVEQVQPELASNVNKLLCSLSTVVEQAKYSCIDYRTLTDLHQALVTFLPDIEPTTMKPNNVDLLPLDIYCCVKRKEDVLNRGLRQLQELNTHFCRLATRRCT